MLSLSLRGGGRCCAEGKYVLWTWRWLLPDCLGVMQWAVRDGNTRDFGWIGVVMGMGVDFLLFGLRCSSIFSGCGGCCCWVGPRCMLSELLHVDGLVLISETVKKLRNCFIG